jgi:ribosomal protein L11 methyltransferase
MAWLEVSLTVNGEAAEAVADLLTRFAPEGVALQAAHVVQPPESEQAQGSDEVIVSAYLPVDAGLEGKRAQLEQGLWHLGQLLPLPNPSYRPVAETDWSESWKANFQPLRVGKRLMIVPAWLNPPLVPDDIAIRLDPGMAFGTGTHPTTQLCLEAIERHLKPGASMLDLGTGSGILAIAAAKLGAGPVLALDVDPEAVRVASENVIANGVVPAGPVVAGENVAANGVVAAGRAAIAQGVGVRVAQGSLAEIFAGRFAPEWQPAPLVVANILAHIIVQLLNAGLAETVAPGGLLVLSGILDSQAYQVIAALRAQGLTLAGQEHIEDWVAIIARKDAQ